MTSQINIYGIDLTVDYYYEAGEARVSYYEDMSGYPGSPEMVEIYEVGVDDTNIYDLLSTGVIDMIEEKLLQLNRR